jgi:glycosyltransferase involved in cell wall biosynthesis
MKINWFSNSPWAATGYGNQTRVFAPRLRRLGHEMSITAFYGLQGAPIGWEGIPVYPVAKHPYGQDIMNAHAVNARAEAIISLLDVWVCQPENLTLPWFPWFPIDHEPIPDKVLEIARRATRGITMSRFGQKMAENAGLETFYVPHGVDTGVFRPIDRGEARKYLGLPADAFVVGMVAANKGNPPRKSFFEQIAAFQQLKIKHPDALLYLHTDDGTHGGETVNLVRFCERLGLRPAVDVVFCDQYINALGFKDEYMVAAYNAMDVLTLASLGEGFGIPLVEAQACGTPVITGEWTAMGELCFSGWKIPKAEAQREYHDYFDAYQWRVNVEAVEQRLFAAYEMRGNQQYRSRARDGALAYDADKVVEKYWIPVLAEIERLVREAVQA